MSDRRESPFDTTRKATVFIGVRDKDGKPEFIGTGVLVQLKGVYHVVTAKHVLVDPNTDVVVDNMVEIFYNAKGGGIKSSRVEELKARGGVEWIFHENPAVDLAAIPMDIYAESDDIRVIPEEMMIDSSQLYTLYGVFFFSYHPDVPLPGKISPIARTGTISLISDDGTFLVDGFVFPGNSGSPVYLTPSPVLKRFDDERTGFNQDPHAGKLAGIISGYIPYKEIAFSMQTGHARVVFEENTGLFKVWSVDCIRQIAASDKFKQQVDSVKSQFGT